MGRAPKQGTGCAGDVLRAVRHVLSCAGQHHHHRQMLAPAGQAPVCCAVPAVVGGVPGMLCRAHPTGHTHTCTHEFPACCFARSARTHVPPALPPPPCRRVGRAGSEHRGVARAAGKRHRVPRPPAQLPGHGRRPCGVPQRLLLRPHPGRRAVEGPRVAHADAQLPGKQGPVRGQVSSQTDEALSLLFRRPSTAMLAATLSICV